MKKILTFILLLTSIGLAKTFDPTKLSNGDFATVANVMGMTTVFVVLLVLALLIAFMGKLISSSERKKEDKHVKEVAVQTIIKEPIKEEKSEDQEVAAITAAIYTVLGHKNFKILNYKKSNTINTWKRLTMNNDRRKRKW